MIKTKPEEFISKWGRLYACPSGKIFETLPGGEVREKNFSQTKDGYFYFHFSIMGFGKQCAVHRFVWRFFNGPIPPKMQIHHIDHDPTNNDVNNLSLVTSAENNRLRRPYAGRKPLFKALERANRTGRMP